MHLDLAQDFRRALAAADRARGVTLADLDDWVPREDVSTVLSETFGE